MKKIYTLLCLAILLPFLATAQWAYIPKFLSGDLDHTDLTNPGNYTTVGTTVINLGAADFDLNGDFFGISGSDNGLYQIDTLDGSSTFIATVIPPGTEFWTGMACDPTDGTMFIASTDGNGSSFYTLDLTNGTKTLIGTNTDEDGVVGIAFDDSGQMYAAYLVRKFFMIDKTDGSATFIGDFSTACTAGQWHGLEFCSENQTMYMTSYNAFSFDNELYTVDLSTGLNTFVGSIGVWGASLGCSPPGMSAAFSSDVTEVCEGGSVNFNDESNGNVSSWEWTFEGGSPGTSTSQNPSVTYSTVGAYDVRLVAGNGSSYDTLLTEDYITVIEEPGQANTPTGPTETCGGGMYDYSTAPVGSATSYQWQVDPSEAGTMIGNTATVSFAASTSWTGTYTIKVRGENDCGYGQWSPGFDATLNLQPAQFSLIGSGGYCEGDPGVEVTLDGSETGVDYELYKDGITTGNIVPGTGSPISFGYQEEGYYTAKGSAGSCIQDMVGQNYIYLEELPEQAGTPTGPETVCNNDTSLYTTTGAPNAETITYVLDPAEAGTLNPGDVSVEIIWSQDFSGSASLTVYGTNVCGDGPVSDELEISVLETPDPAISGPATVCTEDIETYTTADNPDNTYTWEVDGGTIVSGAGTNEITVEWGDPGTGYVMVTEDNGTCLTTTEEYNVLIEECTSLDEQALNDLRIYPNPTREFTTITSEDRITSITVFNLAGELQAEIRADDNQYILNTSEYSSGIYLIRIESEGKMEYRKLIIE